MVVNIEEVLRCRGEETIGFQSILDFRRNAYENELTFGKGVRKGNMIDIR